MEPTSSLFVAAKTCNNANGSMESVNARIHDGVPLELPVPREDGYARTLLDLFPGLALTAGAFGLDIAEHMRTKAKQGLAGLRPFVFKYYDGITVPLEDGLLIISVASPRRRIFQSFCVQCAFEMRRILKPDCWSCCAFYHMVTFAAQERLYSVARGN